MIDLNSDKIDNPEDNTQENEKVENSSIKKRAESNISCTPFALSNR